MTKITIDEYSAGASHKQFVADFNIAFAKADVDAIVSMFADDATWELVGGGIYEGKDNIRSAMNEMKFQEANEIVVDNIIAEGERCAANGVMLYGDSKVAFCDVYVFESPAQDAKVRSLTSYGVEL